MLNNTLVSPYYKELTLLFVDDSQSIRLTYNAFFEDLFKELLFANDGEEALMLVEQADIIITDYQMPNMNGIEMISIIRETNPDIPVILATAFEETDVLIRAIHLGINGFVKKPFDINDVFKAINSAIQLLIGHNYLLQEQEKQIKDLKEKEDYSIYQEELSFKKELSMIRNDFYYSLCQQHHTDKLYLCDFLYRPLDTMSGDLYSARQLSDFQELYFLVDGMGKGLSASVSAIIFTTFINYLIDQNLKHNASFGFESCINAVVAFMREHLLEEEVLAASFVLINTQKESMQYASFGMPSILLMDNKESLITLSSNNPPICQYTFHAKTSTFDMQDITKILIASDGIYENSVMDKNKTYADYIHEDFKASATNQDFFTRLKEKTDIQEDDMTFIFIHQVNLNHKITSTTIPAKLDNIYEANSWYEAQLYNLSEDLSMSIKASLSFTELLMNAYEHGSLGITSAQKHQLMDEEEYIDFLKEKEKTINKEIYISIFTFTNSKGEKYLLTSIEDQGEGFDSNIFKEIFHFHKNFNGRGVSIAKHSSIGIYYNTKGNIVYYLNKLTSV